MIPEWEALARLLLAVVLGGVIGLERESVDKPAGFRTNILVCVGAALFSVISRGDVLVALGEVDGVDEARWES